MMSKWKQILADYHLTITTLLAVIILLLGPMFIVIPDIFESASKEIFQSLGLGLLSAGIVALIFEFALDRVRRDRVSEDVGKAIKRALEQSSGQIPSVVNSAINEILTPGVQKAIDAAVRSIRGVEPLGIVDIHPDQPVGLVKQIFQEASKEILILQTWIDNFKEFEDAIYRAVEENNCEVRILLTNPNSPHAKARSRDLDLPENYVVEHIKDTIEQVQRLKHSLRAKGKRVKLGLYESTPIMTIHSGDSRIVQGFFFSGHYALQSPHIEFASWDSTLSKALKEYFESVWANADKHQSKTGKVDRKSTR